MSEELCGWEATLSDPSNARLRAELSALKSKPTGPDLTPKEWHHISMQATGGTESLKWLHEAAIELKRNAYAAGVAQAVRMSSEECWQEINQAVLQHITHMGYKLSIKAINEHGVEQAVLSMIDDAMLAAKSACTSVPLTDDEWQRELAATGSPQRAAASIVARRIAPQRRGKMTVDETDRLADLALCACCTQAALDNNDIDEDEYALNEAYEITWGRLKNYVNSLLTGPTPEEDTNG